MCKDNQYVPVLLNPNSERIKKLHNFFIKKYEVDPDYFTRVPGRVNLIGEHIDYCGYGVCPMALEQDILLAVKVIPNSTNLKISNVDKKYEDYECNLNHISIDVRNPKWYNYFLCGIKGIQDHNEQNLKFGLNVSVFGNIPPGSGLSSSSAFVSSSVLAIAYASKLNLTKQELADISASCERYIGTQGGGMDQAIAFLASEGCAKLIDFDPLRSRDVILPPSAVFVISHSLASLNKAATADFNCRVMECKLAAKLLAKKNNLKWEKIEKLKQFQEELDVDLEKAIEIVDKNLHDQPYTKEKLCNELAIEKHQLEEILSFNTKHINTFKLRQRALHVFEEALRVKQFYEICKERQCQNTINNEQDEFDILKSLGKLMTDSHESLRKLYECSHPNLDRIVSLSEDLTFGTRLTGAGWGGCAVALVQPNYVNKYIETLKEQFYQDRNISGNKENLVFITSPKNGACIYLNP